MLFTYNDQDDVVLHYLRKFEGKPIISAENYLSEAEDVKPETEPEVKDVDPKGTKNYISYFFKLVYLQTC